MKALVLSSRNPWPPYTGDRVRTTMWIGALEKIAEVTVVAPGNGVEFSPLRLASAAMTAFVRGLPWHSALAGAYDWRGAIARATAERGPFDATIVLLSRFDPWVRDTPGGGRRILDAIDSLRRSMVERERESGPLLRWLWRAEERRTAKLEREAGRRYDRVVITNAEDRDELGGATTVVPMGVPIAPLGDARRVFDFGFWGSLSYFANQDAVRLLLGEIWPVIRTRHPQATLVIGGARAPRDILARNGAGGITVISPVDDMPALARQVKIALFPIQFGTGVSTKVLEAAEAGCALATTPTGVRGLDAIAGHALVQRNISQLADAAADLLADDVRRSEMGARLRAAVEASYSRERAMEKLAEVAFPPEART